MGAEAPQWLFVSFVEAMQEIGATASPEALEAEARDLVARWCAPDRHAHNTRHLINVLAHLDELSSTAHDPDVLRVATWYHGALLNKAVTAPVRGADPRKGASGCCLHTRTRLAALGVSEDVTDRVVELIDLMTRHACARDDVDAQVLVDADLALLADTPQEYKKYRQLLREEFVDVDDLTYYLARRRVVRGLLARDSVFQSPLGQAWEERARANLEVELAKIEDAIALLDPEALNVDDASMAPDLGNEALGTVDEATTTTGTIIIKRRHLNKNQTARVDDEVTTTGQLPLLAPEEEPQRPAESDEPDASSLETAIEALDVPSRPSGD